MNERDMKMVTDDLREALEPLALAEERARHETVATYVLAARAVRTFMELALRAGGSRSSTGRLVEAFFEHSRPTEIRAQLTEPLRMAADDIDPTSKYITVIEFLLAMIARATDKAPETEPIARVRRELEIALSQLYPFAARSAAVSARESAKEVANVRRSIETVATAEATGTLFEHFDAVHRREERMGNGFRLATVGLIVTLVIVAAVLDEGGSTTADVVRRIAFVVPGLALAAYLGRQAFIHLSVARWAQSLAVQLRSVQAYAAGLSDDEAKTKLLAVFGDRVFTGRQPAISAKAEQQVTDDVEGLLDKLTEVLRAATAKEP
jgi:hypothetical protein